MSYERKYPDWENKILMAANSTNSAAQAASLLGIKYDTYRKYAIKYGCFNTNQSGKGNTRFKKSILLSEILEGKHPQYQSNKLRLRLLSENIFEHKCYSCGLSEWLGVPIPIELEHIDGDSKNHIITNLTLLCPNCHALTDTYRGKNKGIPKA
jgi:5-methylcytosine-specific restriction endonuclease McrA